MDAVIASSKLNRADQVEERMDTTVLETDHQPKVCEMFGASQRVENLKSLLLSPLQIRMRSPL